MNLWVRTLRQLTMLAVALFFFSCEDETSILGFKNPNKKFQVGYVDIALNTSTVLAIDSLITDLRPLVENLQVRPVDGILVGQYQDSDFGKVSAQSFLSVYPTNTTALPATAVYDSITVEFRLNFYANGFTGTQEKRIAIHEITGDTLTFFGGNRYYYNSPAPQYSVDPIGESVFTVKYDSLQKQAATLTRDQDTLLAEARLSDDFGTRVFEAIKPGLATAETQRIFKSQIKGLALIPADDQGVLGFNVINTAGQPSNTYGHLSRIFLHYHTLTEGGAVDDTLSRAFGFDITTFTRIETDRTGTALAGIQPYQSIDPGSSVRYVQSGSPVLTKIDLAPFYAFADTVDNVLINSAEFVIDNVTAPEGLKPPALLRFLLMNNQSEQFLNARVAADRDYLTQWRYHILGAENYFTPSVDGTEGVTIQYKEDEDRYSGFMTRFAQSLFVNKNDADGINENRLKYITLFPVSPPAAKSVSRTVFSADNVKLRIYYTRANTVTP